MKHDTDDAFHSAMKILADDIANFRFDGTNIIGKNGLVSANVKTRKVEFRRTAGDQPFYVADIPVTGCTGSMQAMTKLLTVPALRRWKTFDALDDLTSVLAAFVEWTNREEKV